MYDKLLKPRQSFGITLYNTTAQDIQVQYNGIAGEGGGSSCVRPGRQTAGAGKMGDEANALKEEEILFSTVNKY